MQEPLLEGRKREDSYTRRPGDRLVRINGPDITYEPEAEYSDNYVITSSYTWWNFVPKNLFEQFSNLANLYFLGIGVLQLIRPISTTGGNPTMYQPLAFIVLVSAIRAAHEDWGKHKADAARNGYEYEALGHGGWTRVKSGEIKVGQVIKVKQDDMVPADMILIGSALDKGHCFIDKANLNGETCLEVLNSIKETRKFKTDKELQGLQASLIYAPPDGKFDHFRGNLRLTSPTSPQQDIPLNDGKILLMRETNLKNCEYVYGLVVYTGSDTKIQMSNSDGGSAAKLKKSTIMRMVDTLLGRMLGIQALLCLIGAISAGTWVASHESAWYLQLDPGQSWKDGFLAFFTWFILLSQMVPISLIVSSEMVKFVQSMFIQWDSQLYHPPIKKGAKCNSSTIHEELGLVDYIFSDKTGTLTQNKMEFRYILTQNSEYGSKDTEIAKAVRSRKTELENKQKLGDNYKPPTPPMWTSLLKALREREDQVPRSPSRTFSLNDSDKEPATSSGAAVLNANEFTDEQRKEVLQALWGPPPPDVTKKEHEEHQVTLRNYMRHMALSNTVRPYEEKNGGEIRFQSESAEESAMVLFAQSLGFIKLQVNPTVLVVRVYDEDLKVKGHVKELYRHVATLGFTSQRARVSVIYQRVTYGSSDWESLSRELGKPPQSVTVDDNPPSEIRDLDFDKDKPIYVMTKGQDSVILPLLSHCPNEDNLILTLKELCSNGLRTLVCGHAVLSTSWWQSLQSGYVSHSNAEETVHSRGHGSGKCGNQCEKCACHQFYEKMEKDAKLDYLGCMGLEDQLQPLVPEAIQDYLRAGVKVWMITGDKLDTAKNIGLACNLIDSDMEPQLEQGDAVEKISESLSSSRLLIITGQWANLAESDEELTKLFEMFQLDNHGKISQSELRTCLRALGYPPDRVQNIFAAKGDGGIDRATFIQIMRNNQVTMYDAVKHDIEESTRRYMEIEDHVNFPVSLLVNRSAFEVMFAKPSEHKASSQSKSPTSENSTSSPPPEAENKEAINIPPSISRIGTEEPSEADREALRSKFFLLASVSKSVVFARAEPAMKKRMVTEIQKRVPTAVTLAIGDGANDTDMITAAHVGIGISGVEGTAATNSADYAIGTFYMLHSLMLVHGFWNYHRIAFLVYFIFYKACLVAVTSYFFGFYSGFSGQQFFNDPIYQLYNVVFTALPVLAVAILDQQLPRHTLENNPRAFSEARGRAFRTRGFGGWIFRSFAHSIIIFFIPFWSLNTDLMGPDGLTHGMWYTSTIVYHCVVLVPTLIILYDMQTITYLHRATIFLSIAALFLACYLASILSSANPDLYGIVAQVYSHPHAWLIMLVCITVPMCLELAWRGARRDLRPSFTQILQERERRQRNRVKETKLTEKAALLVKQIPDSEVEVSLVGAPQETKEPKIPRQGSTDEVPELVGTEEFNDGWANRKAKTSRKPLDQEALKALRKKLQEEKEQEGKKIKDSETRLRSSVIRSLLRFRNLTGAQFDSAAQAKYQKHDDFSHEEEETKKSNHGSSSSSSSNSSSSDVERGTSDGIEV